MREFDSTDYNHYNHYTTTTIVTTMTEERLLYVSVEAHMFALDYVTSGYVDADIEMS